MTQYRVRLDTTTNWAVGTTAAITTFALSSRELPHYVLALPVLLNLLFLWMESRRFRGMVLIAQRVRLLERAPMPPLGHFSMTRYQRLLPAA